MWSYDYDTETGESTIYYDGTEIKTVETETTRIRNGYPSDDDIIKTVRDEIKSADGATQTDMMLDLILFGINQE